MLGEKECVINNREINDKLKKNNDSDNIIFQAIVTTKYD